MRMYISKKKKLLKKKGKKNVGHAHQNLVNYTLAKNG